MWSGLGFDSGLLCVFLLQTASSAQHFTYCTDLDLHDCGPYLQRSTLCTVHLANLLADISLTMNLSANMSAGEKFLSVGRQIVIIWFSFFSVRLLVMANCFPMFYCRPIKFLLLWFVGKCFFVSADKSAQQKLLSVDRVWTAYKADPCSGNQWQLATLWDSGPLPFACIPIVVTQSFFSKTVNGKICPAVQCCFMTVLH